MCFQKRITCSTVILRGNLCIWNCTMMLWHGLQSIIGGAILKVSTQASSVAIPLCENEDRLRSLSKSPPASFFTIAEGLTISADRNSFRAKPDERRQMMTERMAGL